MLHLKTTILESLIAIGGILFTALPPLAAAQTASEPNEPRHTYNFNADWKLFVGDPTGAEARAFNDQQWKGVTLPHAWNEDAAFRVSIEQLPTGVAWYRKHFKMPADAAGKRVFLEFQGIRQGGEFFVNGKSVGVHENGVMAFGFDITAAIKPPGQENVVAARIDNSWGYKDRAANSGFQWNDRNFYANYGGINKNVLLHVTSPLHQTLPLFSNLGTTGVYVYASDIAVAGKSAKVTAEAQVKNDDVQAKTFGYQVSIADLDGKVVKTFDGEQRTLKPGETTTVIASAKLDGLNFWSWGYGYLYTVTTTLTVDGKPLDVVQTRTGFRKTEFSHGELKLNERVMQVHGYAQRSTNEWPGVGQSVPPWMSDFSNALFVESNGNLVRWMHVTPPKQDVESCDRVGLLQAMPAGDSEGDPSGHRWDFRVLLMRDAIIYNRNNPSIVFYEVGNHGVREEHMKQMLDVRNQYDPHGGRAMGSREMLDSKLAEYGGDMLYINKSAGKPLWAMEYDRDEGLRKYWDDWTAPFHKNGDGPPAPKGESGAAYNQNRDMAAVEDVDRWFDYWHERPGTGERVNGGGVNIYFSDSNTHHRGAASYRCSGEVDAMRIPKDGFFAHQVMWDGWVNVEHPRIYIIGHWNYEANVRKPVYVVSSADKVELFTNDQSKGMGEQSSRFLYTWKDVPFAAGQIKAVGYDAGGKKLCETVIRTAGAAVAIKLTPHTGPSGLKADGADMALVDVEVVDAQGNRCPTAMNVIKFDLQGPAEWRGGIAVGPDNCILSRELPVECGVNRVILRSEPQAGAIILNAASAGLAPARLELASTLYPTMDGVSQTLPDAGLTTRLDRGPTPAGDSLIPTRRAVRIVSATAGSNAAQAARAFDDDEETAWKSDGPPGTAWIQFTLERPANVSEVVLKLGGWRKKSYPLRITVDGKEAYSDRTPKTLGYVTLSLKPMHGHVVRIALAGAVDERDGFGIVEVTGKKLKDSAEPGGKGALEVIEAEIYEPLTGSVEPKE